ncbi:uncharacterized protein LOC119832875 isoform X2 [Zerene cesonia]|uniref:uncharacterized protein LOC119832875 isoform X2 n=1 Tax=Zerene cesonia TaxID=33412 RepID=UPI0018E5075D|nr:uncharacterized protein LOC119832875 isoform X2 [Zerene cesonia]
MVVFYLLLLPCVTLAHSGAYSSPQYAKKMYPKNFDTSAFLPKDNPAHFKSEWIDRFDNSLNDTSQYGRASFLDTAGSFLSGAGSQVMSSLAKDFIARSTGSSQVLSLNLTNLVILIVLKALVLAAGFFGAGAWKGHHYGRSLEDNKNASYITEDEILLYLSYLVGQQTQDYGCLYRLACQKPHQAAIYASGAELILQGTKLVQGNSIDLEPYENVSRGIQVATARGEQGKPCDKIYQCT